MKEKLKSILAVLIIMILMPYVISIFLSGGSENPVANIMEEAIKEEQMYLLGTVAKQIPMTYEDEAIKAQIVIAQTNYQKEKLEQKPLTYLSIEELEQLWGKKNFSAYFSRLSQLIDATKGIALQYEGNYIDAACHAVSSGVTRNGQEAFEAESYPYFQSVNSKQDIVSPDFLKIVSFTQDEVIQKGTEYFESWNLDVNTFFTQISILERETGDYVKLMQFGDKQIKGEEFRDCFGLNSACFFIEEYEGKLRIITKGLGHGIGLSQYGANELAKQGKTYQEILNYYYTNITLTTLGNE